LIELTLSVQTADINRISSPNGTGDCLQEVMWPKREAYHSPPGPTKVEIWTCKSSLPSFLWNGA